MDCHHLLRCVFHVFSFMGMAGLLHCVSKFNLPFLWVLYLSAIILPLGYPTVHYHFFNSFYKPIYPRLDKFVNQMSPTSILITKSTLTTFHYLLHYGIKGHPMVLMTTSWFASYLISTITLASNGHDTTGIVLSITKNFHPLVIHYIFEIMYGKVTFDMHHLLLVTLPFILGCISYVTPHHFNDDEQDVENRVAHMV